jgi:PRC-barrel domain
VSAPKRPQVSWKAIEADAPVFSSEGEAVGKVTSVVGDQDADVFTGLAISVATFGRDRFVPSERVRGIWSDRVDLGLTKAEIERLPEYEETPTVRWRPDTGVGGLLRRFLRRR